MTERLERLTIHADGGELFVGQASDGSGRVEIVVLGGGSLTRLRLTREALRELVDVYMRTWTDPDPGHKCTICGHWHGTLGGCLVALGEVSVSPSVAA